MARPRKEETEMRHPVAVLRKALALTQKEMATLANCSEVTLYAIQSGRRAMTRKLAQHLCDVTGVSADWLMEGDADAPIVSEDGEPYTREHFEEYQAEYHGVKETKPRLVYEYYGLPESLGFALLKLYAILRKGYVDQRFAWTSYKLHAGIDALAKELGVDRTLEEKLDSLKFEGHGGETFMSTVHFIFRTHNEAFRKKVGALEAQKEGRRINIRPRGKRRL